MSLAHVVQQACGVADEQCGHGTDALIAEAAPGFERISFRLTAGPVQPQRPAVSGVEASNTARQAPPRATSSIPGGASVPRRRTDRQDDLIQLLGPRSSLEQQ